MQPNSSNTENTECSYSLHCEPTSIFNEIYMDIIYKQKKEFIGPAIVALIYIWLGLLTLYSNNYNLLILILFILPIGASFLFLSYYKRVCYNEYGEAFFHSKGIHLKGTSKHFFFSWKRCFISIPWDAMTIYNVYDYNNYKVLRVKTVEGEVIGEWANITYQPGIYVFFYFDKERNKKSVTGFDIKWLNEEKIDGVKATFAQHNIPCCENIVIRTTDRPKL